MSVEVVSGCVIAVSAAASLDSVVEEPPPQAKKARAKPHTIANAISFFIGTGF